MVTQSIRGAYETHGVDGYYRQFGSSYRNPHEPEVVKSLSGAITLWGLDITRVLDLAAGSGEASMVVRAMGAEVIHGIDPMTSKAYEARLGVPTEPFTFADVAAGALTGRSYSLIVCSFALHLCELSRLPGVCLQLAEIAPRMVVVTPHKRPILQDSWGWSQTGEIESHRIRTRLYASSRS